MPGWGQLLTWRDPKTGGSSVPIGNASSVILVAVLLFALRIEGRPLLEWKAVQVRLPWGLILLLGGGFAMAEASQSSCLSAWIGSRLARMGGSLDPWVIGLLICILVSFLTEITSNTATANVILPILLRLASSLSLPLVYFSLPAAICCSYAFMLPVATPPNAMVFEAINNSGKTERMILIHFIDKQRSILRFFSFPLSLSR